MAARKKRKATPAQLRALKKGRAALAAKRKKNPVRKKVTAKKSVVAKKPARKKSVRRKNPATSTQLRRTPTVRRGAKRRTPQKLRRINPARMYIGVAFDTGSGTLYFFTGNAFGSRRDAAQFHTARQCQKVMKDYIKRLGGSRTVGFKFGIAHTDETRDKIIADLMAGKR